jgi:hypothetical protein
LGPTGASGRNLAGLLVFMQVVMHLQAGFNMSSAVPAAQATHPSLRGTFLWLWTARHCAACSMLQGHICIHTPPTHLHSCHHGSLGTPSSGAAHTAAPAAAAPALVTRLVAGGSFLCGKRS